MDVITDIDELSTKLSGIILKKAEWEGDFDKVYSKVFETLAQSELVGNEQILEVFGNVGG